MRLHAFTGSLLLLLLAPLGAARPQTGGDLRAFVALDASHIGALTPVLSPAIYGRALRSAQLGVRYGLQREAGTTRHAVAGSAIFQAGLASTFSVTAGVSDQDCLDCAPEMMLGLGGDMRVFEAGDVMGPGSSFNLGVSGELGYAQIKPQDISTFAIGIGAPMALSFAGGGATGMRFVPYFTPMLGIGQLNRDCVTPGCQNSGTRWVLGGGIAVWNPLTSVSASVGVNQVMQDGSPPAFGVNVTFGGR